MRCVCGSNFVCFQILPRSNVADSDYTLWGAAGLNTEIREAEIGMETVQTKTQENTRDCSMWCAKWYPNQSIDPD